MSSTVAEIDARKSETERLASSSLAALRILTGVRDMRVPDCPMEAMEYEIRPLAWYVRAARTHRPEAGMLDAGLEARAANVDATRARFFPDLAIGASATFAYGPGIVEQTDPFIVERSSYGVGAGLVARWSLDLWGNAYRVERAEQELLQLRAQRDEAHRGIALEVETTYHELLDAQRREEAWGRGHRDGRAWFLAAAQAYEIGTLESRDLVDAVRTYFTARFNHITAVRDFNTAVAKLERAVGVQLAAPDRWAPGCEPIE